MLLNLPLSIREVTATLLRRTSLKLNFIINVFGMGLPFVVALITIPYYISFIGPTRYGILSIVWILLGYFGFIDLGLSRACTNALARLAGASALERAKVLVTSLQLNFLFGVTGAAAFYFIGGILLRKMLNLSTSMGVEADAALPWIAGMLPLTLLTATSRGALESRERFLVVNLIDVSGALAGQILPLFAAILIAPTLPVVMAAAFGAKAFSALLTLGCVTRQERLTSVVAFDRTLAVQLLRFGAWVSITSIIGPILSFLDQLFVGTLFGPIAIAHYVVPMNLVVRTQIIAGALSRAVFPQLSVLGRESALDRTETSVISLAYIYGAICAPAVVLADPLMTIWMGSEFASSATPVLRIALIGAWINGMAFITVALLQGQRRPDLVAKLHTLELAPYVFSLWFLLKEFGLVGGALAWTGRVTVDAAILFKLSGFRVGALLRLAPALVLMLASFVLTLRTPAPLMCLFWAGVILLLFVGCALRFDPKSRRLVMAALSLFAKTMRPKRPVVETDR